MKAEDIKTWDDFLGAVKKLKAAGITPIVVGAGEKWPMHFYYSYLVMRIGGEHALADAKAGKDGGFKNATFVEAGKRLRELGGSGAVPAGLSRDQACGIGRHVRRRQGGDGSHGPMAARHAGSELDQRQGLGRRGYRHPVLPDRTRRQGQGDRHLGRRQRLAREQVRAPGGGRFPQVLQPGEVREGGGGERRPIYRSSRARRPRSPIRISSASPPISPRRPTTRTISIRTSDPPLAGSSTTCRWRSQPAR